MAVDLVFALDRFAGFGIDEFAVYPVAGLAVEYMEAAFEAAVNSATGAWHIADFENAFPVRLVSPPI
jgi:hypothetical protein